MTWNVFYRGKNGISEIISIEAPSRAEVFAELKKLGISAVRIEQSSSKKGKVKPYMDHMRPGSRRPSIWRGIMAAAIVILLAVAAWFLVSRPAESRNGKRVKKPTKIANVTPSNAPTSSKPVWAAPRAEDGAKAETPKAPVDRVVSVETNSTGYIIEHVIQPNGRPLRRVREPPSIWESGTDRIIASALVVAEGQDIPPLPPIGRSEEAEFLDSLKKPIRILDTDSDEVKAMKQIVRSAREEIKARIDAGESFREVLEDHRYFSNDNGRIRADAIKEMLEISRTGTKEDLNRYVNVMNAALSQMGIDPISAPSESESSEQENP